MATRQSRLDRFRRAYDCDENNYLTLFSSLFINSVKTENIDAKHRYIMDCLLKTGRVGQDKITGLWGTWYGEGIREDGEPLKVRFWFRNGKQLPARDRDDCILFRANPQGNSIYEYLYQQANLLAEFDNAIRQNLDGTRQSVSIITRDKTFFNELANANKQRIMGASTVHLTSATLTAGDVTALKTGVDYLIGDLLRDKQTIFNNVINVLGTNTGLSCKKERVQATEVDSANAYSEDCIGIMVDTFNTDAKEQGSPARMYINNLNTQVGQTVEEGDENNGENMDV